MPLKAALTRLASGRELTVDEASQAMHVLMQGKATPEQVAGLLMGLRGRGESLDELVTFTGVMREYAVRVRVDDPAAIDIVGTGGDSGGTFNISTAAMLVCAGAGATVAKHGNRSVSSKCGSADVLEALDVRIDLQAPGVEACLRDVGMGFMFAPLFHPALRNVMPVRRALAVRTFFNILGPLCNPAFVTRGVFGAFSRDVAETSAEILSRLGAAHVVAVHSDDGLDEFSLSAPSMAFELVGTEAPVVRTVRAEDLGLGAADLDAIRGGDAAENAGIIRGVLAGRPGPHRDVVLLNAAHGLVAAGLAADAAEGVRLAAESIDSGKAARKLTDLVDASRAHAADIG
jgi:anthranilate phosphoribosyltransferase